MGKPRWRDRGKVCSRRRHRTSVWRLEAALPAHGHRLRRPLRLDRHGTMPRHHHPARFAESVKTVFSRRIGQVLTGNGSRLQGGFADYAKAQVLATLPHLAEKSEIEFARLRCDNGLRISLSGRTARITTTQHDREAFPRQMFAAGQKKQKQILDVIMATKAWERGGDS